MNYEPSHRRPPRQERWPSATPGEGWPAYQQGDDGRAWESAQALAGSRTGYGAISNGYGATANGYGYGDALDGRGATGNGYGDALDGGGVTGNGYGDAWDGGGAARYGGPGGRYETPNTWNGYAQPGYEFTEPAAYQAQEEYPELDTATSSVLVAPDTMGEWWRQPDRGDDPGREQGRGPAVGAVTGLLAAAVTIGVATLAAAFVRPQASPVSAVSGAFIDQIPAALRNHLMAHFGARGQTILLLGTIGLAAIVLGCMARRNASLGVTGIAAFGLLGAFVAITRPEGRASDVIPSAVGALAGIVALLWLARASAPAAPAPGVASLRPADGGGRRRAR
jgi:hypothetical protein